MKIDDQLPVLDWELCDKLANHNRQHAEEYIALLKEQLSNQLPMIEKYYEARDIENLRYQIHYILGALCYCGAVRLKMATEEFHKHINDNENMESFYLDFKAEAELLALSPLPPK